MSKIRVAPVDEETFARLWCLCGSSPEISNESGMWFLKSKPGSLGRMVFLLDGYQKTVIVSPPEFVCSVMGLFSSVTAEEFLATIPLLSLS